MIFKNSNMYIITFQTEYMDLFTHSMDPSRSGYVIYDIKKTNNRNRLYPDFIRIRMVKSNLKFSLEESVESIVTTKDQSSIKIIYHNYNESFLDQISIDHIIDNMMKYSDEEVKKLNKFITNAPTFDEMK